MEEEKSSDIVHADDLKAEESLLECPTKEELAKEVEVCEVEASQREDLEISTIQTVHILPVSSAVSGQPGDLDSQSCLDPQVITDAEIISSAELTPLPQAVVLTTSVLSTMCPNALSPDAAGSVDCVDEEDEQHKGLLITKGDSDGLLMPKVEPGQTYIGLTTTVTGISGSEDAKLITTSAGEKIVVTAHQTSMCYLRQIFDHDQVTCTEGEMSTLVASNEVPELQQCKWENCCQHFLSLNDLVHHVTECHIHFDKDSEYRCLWQGCNRNGKGFNARYKMLIHMRTHTGERPHRCHYDSCGKSFSRLENLKIHQRSHTGERPYTCPIEGCDKRYSNSSDRFKHTRTHYERKPYHCRIEGCQKRYTDPSSLRKHLKTHHGQEMSIEVDPD